MLPKGWSTVLRVVLSVWVIFTVCTIPARSQIQQPPATDIHHEKPSAQQPETALPPSGVFFAALRTQNHIARSSVDRFNEAADGIEQFLTTNNVLLREDPIRGKFRLESTMSKENLIHVAEDADAKLVLQLTVDRPATAWIELTIQCFDLQGKQLWEERAAGANQFSPSGHVQKAVKKLTSRLEPKLGTECLPQSGGSPLSRHQNDEK
jgi:hypothetical protein